MDTPELIMEIIEIVPKLLQASSVNVFLTGKAGTGKTSLLRKIKESTSKNHIVVSFTAAAALNAGGVTMHSFFQMPFGPLIPQSENDFSISQTTKRYSSEKTALIRSLELIIIDEVSMIRADMIDFLDSILKKIRLNGRPFGGVQLLFIGDPLQLPPIKENWDILSKYYPSPYFFDSLTYKNAGVINIELQKVYRQDDQTFVNLLDRVRMGSITQESIDLLNNKCTDLDLSTDQRYITITTHHRIANAINRSNLNSLSGEVFAYKATITGEFPLDSLPAAEIIELKIGARVIMIKNDDSGKKRYYNGRAAQVVQLDENAITVRFLDDFTELDLEPQTWQNVKYSLGQAEKKIQEDHIGSFSQYPIKLAWAITVHKSQGLTFDKVILDIADSFEAGQAYVALSRCRSLDGIVLRQPITQNSIRADQTAIEFIDNIQKQQSEEIFLSDLQNKGQHLILLDFFDFRFLECIINEIEALTADLAEAVIPLPILEELYNTIIKPANKFTTNEIGKLTIDQQLKENTEFVKRIESASNYFLGQIDRLSEKLKTAIGNSVGIAEQTDKLVELLNETSHLLTIKLAIFKHLVIAPTALTEANEIARESLLKVQHGSKSDSKDEPLVKHPALYEMLQKWRLEHSSKKGIPPHIIMSEKTMQRIAKKTPRTIEEFATISGIGTVKATEIGETIVGIVNTFFGVSKLF